MLAGDWEVIVRDANGQVPNGANVAAETISPEVTSLTPNSDVPPLGGGVLQITGKHFPKNSQEFSLWADNQLSVSVGGEDCSVQSYSQTQITCVTPSVTESTSHSVIVTVKNKVSNSDQ